MIWSIAGLIAAWVAAVGWRAGYREPTAYLEWSVAAALTLCAASAIVARGWPADRGAGLFIRTAVVATAIVVACTGALGAAGRLAIGPVLAVQGFMCGAALMLGVRLNTSATSAPRLPPAAVAIVGTGLAFALAFGATHAPFTLYDSLSYHLFFAGRWVQDHALTVIPTPFSDEAQAYAPANGELVFAWLMLPFHGDLVARLGQFPFGMLGAAAVYALARRGGAPVEQAAYPAAFFLLSRPIVEQMVGANVDLICAALFAASLWLAIAAIDHDRWFDWALLGIALGLYGGSKYLALVYTPVLALVVCARGLRRRMLWALPGIAAFALPWYLRNWAIAGSPIYPASLAIAGVTIARGAFTRAAMLNTIFHTTDIHLLPAMAAHAFGPALFVVWLPLAVPGWMAMVRRGWWPTGVLALIPIAMVPLYWFGFPVNVDSRFLMPAIGPALLPLAFVFPLQRRARAALHALYAAGLAWLVIGVRAKLPGHTPWFMDGWLSLSGLIDPMYLGRAAACATGVAVLWMTVRRSPRALTALSAAVAAIAVALASEVPVSCAPGTYAYLDATPTYIRGGYADAWRWIADNVRGSTIAYTGVNLPYPLSGDRLANRVVYANIDGRARWRFHDYDRAYRAGRFAPTPPFLARSSGELMPVADRSGPRDDAVRPRYERMQGIRDAWVFNLETVQAGYVFVATLSAYEIDYVWHNERSFPIEDEWAQADPTRFHLVFSNPDVHLYAFDAGQKVRS